MKCAWAFILFSSLSLASADNLVEPPPTGQQQTETTSRNALHKEVVRLEAGPAIAVFRGQSTYGINAGFHFRMSPPIPIYLGVDLGFYNFIRFNDLRFNPPPINNQAWSLNLLEVLPSVIVRLGSGKIRPYAGISLGPNFAFSQIRIVSEGTATQTNVYFQTLFRPGVELKLGEKLNLAAEPTFGLLDREWIFIPSVNLVFNL